MKSFNSKAFGQAITNKSFNEEITFREIAKIVKLSPGAIYKISANMVGDIGINTVIRICDWLGVKPEKFFVASKKQPAKKKPTAKAKS